jgi:tight adherence protein B
MNSLITAITFTVITFVVLLVIVSKLSSGKKTRARQMLDELSGDSPFNTERMMEENFSIMRTDFSGNPMLEFFSKMPLGENFCAKILRAGMEDKGSIIILLMLSLTFLLPLAVYESSKSPGFAFLMFVGVPYFFWRFLSGRVAARNRAFISDFPDVLDMIVRSVRSGFPLNTALNMVADNMEPPISTEFRQVVDEIALGRTLDDALVRLSQRIDEQDVKFFIVVLRVQQETGGNLAEVVQNLSNVIRKRKQLRLKIRAMTSEGRATGWILGAIPILMFILLYFIAPTHLEPMLTTHDGNFLLAVSAGLVILAQVIVRKMLDVEI